MQLRKRWVAEKIGPGATLIPSASAARENWMSSKAAAERLNQAAEMTARAYKLGEGSLNDLLTARETMFAQEKTVAQAAKAYSISDTRYRAGAGTILELNTAQLAQTQAQSQQRFGIQGSEQGLVPWLGALVGEQQPSAALRVDTYRHQSGNAADETIHQHRYAALGAQFDEVGALQGGFGEQDAVVGDDADRPAVQPGEAADQRAAVVLLERIEFAVVDQVGRWPVMASFWKAMTASSPMPEK